MSANKQMRRQMRALDNAQAFLERVAIADNLRTLAEEVHDVELLQALKAGKTQLEVAEKLGITKQAVSQRVQNAKKRQRRRERT